MEKECNKEAFKELEEIVQEFKIQLDAIEGLDQFAFKVRVRDKETELHHISVGMGGLPKDKEKHPKEVIDNKIYEIGFSVGE